MKKKWIVITAGVLFLLQVFVCDIYAATIGRYLQGYISRQEEFQLICMNMGAESNTPEQFQISLSGQELPVISVSTIEKEKLPVTFYCLVDVSGSMSKEQMTRVREILHTIAAGMKEEDNMYIGTLGNQITSNGFMTEQNEIKQVINGLEAGHEDTNLYAGIVESIQTLTTDANVHMKKCLLIFSDGQDDQKSGITQDEAKKAVEEAHIPIYSVAVQDATASEKQIEYGKLLGSFARMSAGGVHYTPQMDGMSSEETGQAILDSVRNSIVLTTDPSGITERKDIMLLRVKYLAEDGNSYEDTMEVYGEDLPLPVTNGETETKEQATTVEETTVEETVVEEKQDSSMLPYMVVGIIFVVTVLCVGIVLVLRRKKNKEPEAIIEEETQAKEEVRKEEPEAAGKEQPQKSSTADTKNVYRLKMAAIGYEDIKYTFPLEEGKEMTLGRSGKADLKIGEEDRKVSGVHCRVKWENDKLYVWDLNSTNGTFVNGVPIKEMGRVVVHEGETIRIGSYEYRIG